jgi:hypothetical protein
MKKPNATRKHPKSTRTRPAGKASTKTPKAKPAAKPATLDEIRDYLDQMGDVLNWQSGRIDAIYSEVSALRGEIQIL